MISLYMYEDVLSLLVQLIQWYNLKYKKGETTREEAIARMLAVWKYPWPKYQVLKTIVKSRVNINIIHTCIKRTWYRGRKYRIFASRLLESLWCNVARYRRYNDNFYHVHIFIFSCFFKSYLYVWLFDKIPILWKIQIMLYIMNIDLELHSQHW